MWIVVDVEADGPCPGIYSMVSFGAVAVEPGLGRRFFGQTAPITDAWDPKALAISGVSRQEHLAYPHPSSTMSSFDSWLKRLDQKRLVFASDNPAFDFQFINFYLHKYCGNNPFGWSGRKIGDIWGGYQKDIRKGKDWTKFSKTPHTHNPVDDAMGMAEALLEMSALGIKGIL